ncbi:MAG: HAD-IIB family hydrolase [Promethearchaeota archaeon]
MEPITEIPPEVCEKIRVVFSDIDDTITSSGKILPGAYNALWQLHDAGLQVVPITGRCAGWVDHIARMWPVSGVVGENGAMYFYMTEGGLKKRYYFPPEEARLAKEKLDAIKEEVLARFPQLRVASDQPYREFDLAIDFCEDVPPQPWSVVDGVVEVFHAHGAVTKVSSIHVNGWFGDYDKLSMTRVFARERLDLDLGTRGDREKCVFVGDSANDEPMFAFFPWTVGVANIDKFLGRLEHLPTYRCSREGGLGFAEFAATLLERRSKR